MGVVIILLIRDNIRQDYMLDKILYDIYGDDMYMDMIEMRVNI